MLKFKINNLFFLLMAAWVCQSPVDAKDKLKVFILAGQSNMEGHAKIATFDYIGDDPKTAEMLKAMLDRKKKPRIVKNTWISCYRSHEPGDPEGEGFGPLTAGYGARKNPGELGEKIGPEFTFGLYMQKALNTPILIIKTAWGGKSLYLDFRPPSAGPYEFNQKEKENLKKRGQDLEAERAKMKEKSGRYYGLMMAHVKHVLKDLKRVCPAYDKKAGYEIAGFVWFQGWNDMVNRGVYPNRDQKGGYDQYSQLLCQFINDVRKDLNTPKMPFVIGVMGVNGPLKNVEKRYRKVHGNFREAMAAPAKRSEFKGNVLAVPTAPCWDMELDLIVKKRDSYNHQVRGLKNRVKKGELSEKKMDAEMKKLKAHALTSKEEAVLKRGVSNAAYHYLGCAKTMGLIGKAFAEAMFELRKE